MRVISMVKVAAVAALVSMGGLIQAAPPEFQDVAYAEQLADRLFEHQLPDGGILLYDIHRRHGRLVPYFSNLAALGWVETARVTTDTARQSRYLQGTRDWMDWFADHQNENGTIYDYEGTTNSLQATGTYDSTDSYASTYAVLMWRYHSVSSDTDYVKSRAVAIDGAYRAIMLTMDDDGLTYAHPLYPYKFLMDNVEVAAGFVALRDLFQLLGENEKAVSCEKALEKIKVQFHRMYLPRYKAFGYAIDPFDTKVGDFSKVYPDALANLFAITFLAPESQQTSDFLGVITDQFVKDGETLDFPQWWAWAAMISGNDELRDRALRDLRKLNDKPDVHAHVMGLTAATFTTGHEAIRLKDVVHNWEQLQAPAEPETPISKSASFFVPHTRMILSGHKAKGQLDNQSWKATNATLPLAVNYSLTTASAYLQCNVVLPGLLDLQDAKALKLAYRSQHAADVVQLQATLIEDDGDWWDAAVPGTAQGDNAIVLKLDSLTLNPWSPGGDKTPNLKGIKGIRLQIANKSDNPVTGQIHFEELAIEGN